ncbi:pentatricopeptide repeat-containing protein At4g17616 isoform X2 [Dioscorea cayenensis subsp. rotundata]|uniref:Pentatricopeptide repeat-containing protein At4g17616 isoform X2 n=1 Tax=Dioscorea cayennensis subsp. rotundata TaxID=55577 RepID=A0AB40B715_DIOCR|nr:pentatricopeptide repeat-containing protein At4g17616 isoform X2 [Dioscorea cayenensis subsp. rotundata]
MRGFFGLYKLGNRCLLLASSAKNVNYAQASFCQWNRLHAFVLHGNVRCCTTSSSVRFSWEGSSSFASLMSKLEATLKDDSVDEAWEAFSNYRRLHGFPQKNLLNRMIMLMSYSSNPYWLRKAYEVVLVILEEKPCLLHHDPLTKLAFTLVRSQMPVRAATIIRIMLENRMYPSVEDVWNTLFFHLVKTEVGSYLASYVLIEMCEHVSHHNAKDRRGRQKKLSLPNSTTFNLVLNSCMQHGSVLKAQQLIELMPQMGVVADANSIIIIARFCEMTGQRDELVKLKKHVDGVSSLTLSCHYQQFYDSLLSLHFKYNDLDAAAELMFEMYKRLDLLPSSSGKGKGSHLQRQSLIQFGSSNLRMGFHIMVEPEHLSNNFVVEAKCYSGLILSSNGKLVPSKKALAKLIDGYVRERKVRKISDFLIRIEKELDSQETKLSFEVMDACIQLGLLETAHDILDDMESAEVSVIPCIYGSLLREYCKQEMLDEANVLLKQMRKVDFFVKLSNVNVSMHEVIAESLRLFGDDYDYVIGSVRKSELTELLDKENRSADPRSCLLYELNSSILFFCKAKMMEDAMRTYKRMEQRYVYPTAQTFIHIINGFSSLKMYREISIVWGDIKRKLEEGVLIPDRDLFECLLWNFLRGGYFERVMETIDFMIKHKMFIDKWKYKKDFLKLHKDLYKNLKASHARTEAQSKRLEHVRAFRRWAGIKRNL